MRLKFGENMLRAVLFAIISGITAVIILGFVKDDNKVSDTINKKILANPKKNIKLSDITPFEWDYVVIFSPYSSKDRICSENLTQWIECDSEVPNEGISEGEYFMIFLKNNSVIHTEYHNRKISYFFNEYGSLKISKDSAIFQPVRDHEGKYILVKEMQSENNVKK
jgi:hypothetical protein